MEIPAVFYRVYNDYSRIQDIMRDMVIPKMYREGLGLFEEDAVFLADTVDNALKLCPDAICVRAEERYWKNQYRFMNYCCKEKPDNFTKIFHEPIFYTLEVKREWLDIEKLTERHNNRCNIREWMYYDVIHLYEKPTVTQIKPISYWAFMYNER